jgi:catalase (peroxidase I)
LLEVGLAGFATAAGVNHAADADQIAYFVFSDIRTDGGNFAYDFVAGHQGVNGNAPFVAGLMDVGMAHAAVENLDRDVVEPWAAAFEFYRGEGRGGRLGGVSDGGVHGEPRKSADK